jgi:hypothetical protein
MNGLHECQEQQQQQQQHEVNSSTVLSSASSTDDELDFEKYLDQKESAKHCCLENAPNKIVKNSFTEFKCMFLNALNEVKKFDRSSKLTVQDVLPFIRKLSEILP